METSGLKMVSATIQKQSEHLYDTLEAASKVSYKCSDRFCIFGAASRRRVGYKLKNRQERLIYSGWRSN